MKNPFKIGDIVQCTMDESPIAMSVIEIDGKKIVGRYVDHRNKKIIETKGDYTIFERIPLVQIGNVVLITNC